MRLLKNTVLLVLLYLCYTVAQIDPGEAIVDEGSDTLESSGEAEEEPVYDLAKFQASFQALLRSVLLNTLNIEEKTRSDMSSGIKKIRLRSYGTQTYYSESHAGGAINAAHNHADHKYTIGMGEVTAVMDGVEFRTRHNDYALVRPSTKTQDYHAKEYIKLPDVPESVLAKPTIKGQIKEMQKWFKAFKDQDYSQKDYRKYFKPVLCYMEGKWVYQEKDIHESFESDRHFISAKKYFDLEENVRYEGATGSKDADENKAYLPSKIVGIDNDTLPLIAQWDYRIMCHPLKNDLPLDRFKPVDDLDVRMRMGADMDRFKDSRAVRFELAPTMEGPFRDSMMNPNLLDELMSEIPGLNNYDADIEDTTYGTEKMDAKEEKPLNAGYYHRMYNALGEDASGSGKRVRGFSDQNFFGAMTTHPEVVETCMKDCTVESDYEDCTEYCQRWSYAFPLEIIYTTPLAKWNPYEIEFYEDDEMPEGDGQNGETEDLALNGISNKFFYQTPAEFFKDEGENAGDSADTSALPLFVMDCRCDPQFVRASGHYVITPKIGGDVGEIRQRWPITPLSCEGSHFQKEIDALKEMVLNKDKYAHMYYN